MRIVVGIDGSDASMIALDLVKGAIWPSETTIRLVAAYELPTDWIGLPPPPTESSQYHDAQQRKLFDALQEKSEPLRLRHAAETVVASGRAADVLLAEADDMRADLIVVGNRGRGAAASALLGSVSAALVDHAACPVLVARWPTVRRILVATDGSRSAEAIPAVLLAWGVFGDAPIDVLSVAPTSSRGEGAITFAPILASQPRPPDASHDVDLHRVIAGDMAVRLVAGGRRAEASVRRGEAAREIEAAASDWGDDLIVTGSRGLSGLRRLLLGSVAHQVLVHSRSSVLVMRGHIPARERRALEASAP